MSKSVLLPPIVLIILLLAFPFSSLADQVEDIPDNEERVQALNESATKNSHDESPSAWKRLLGFVGLVDGRSSKSTEQKHIPAAPAVKDSAEQYPIITSEKAESEISAAGKVEQDRIASEKTAAEKLATDKAEKDRTTTAITPVVTKKPPKAPSSSAWQSFMSVVGLRDNRQTIPPLEVNSASLHPGQDYIIGPGDLLGISVWRDDSLTRSVVVLPDGKIQFPLIGEILAGGKSVAMLKKEFVEKLSSYVVDADISVEVKQSNSLFIYIIGKVNNPGRQMLVADTTVLQALAMSGGLNPFAEKDEIKIFRQDRDRTLVFSFRYSQVVSGNYLDDNIVLKRGDLIVVP